MTLRQLLFLSITLLLASCNKEESLPIEETPMLEMQWATRMELDREIPKLNAVKEYGDFVINTGDGIGVSEFYFFDKSSGDLDEKIELFGQDGVGEISKSFVFDNIYVGDGIGFMGFNLDTREVVWKKNYDEYNKFHGLMHKQDNRLFISGHSNEGIEIAEVDPYTGAFSSYYKSDTVGIFSFPVIYNGPAYEHEVAFMNFYPQPGDTPPQLADQTMMAVDAETKEVLWRTSKFTKKYPCNILLPPVIYDDLVITGGDWSIYAFDIHTGEQVWSTEIAPDHGKGVFDKTHHLLHNDKLYVNEAGDKLACLDARTGNIIWINDEAPNCSRHMLYNEEHDLLIMSSWGKGSILIFDALTGELLHTERGFENSTHLNDIIYDPESDLYFADTFKHTMAFKLNYPK